LQFVHPRIEEEAKFILTESVKTSGVELKIMNPLILHESDSGETLTFDQEDKTL
jgi:tRNA1(Val) A37 N6-methylase TrmN6